MKWPGHGRREAGREAERSGAPNHDSAGSYHPPAGTPNPLQQFVADQSAHLQHTFIAVRQGLDGLKRRAALDMARTAHNQERARQGTPKRAAPLASLSTAVQNIAGRGVALGRRGRPNPVAEIAADEEDGNADAVAERILISEVEVRGVEGELQKVALDALTTKPNFAYTLNEVQEDVNRVFETGWFSHCEPLAEDTRDGVKLVIKVLGNPEIKGIVASGANALPQRVVEDAFRDQFGKTLNFAVFGNALTTLNGWYEERGIFGQVIKVDMVQGGVCELKMAEAEVGKITIRTMDHESGETIKGRTKPDVILRQLATRQGAVYSLRQAKQDIDAVYSMGLADDVNMLPQPAEDSTGDRPKVDLTLSIVERKTGGFSAGGGISAAGNEGALPGFIGSMAYSQRNLLGRNQKLTASMEVGQADSLFRLNHTDPWTKGDPYRTSRVVSLQNTRNSGNAIHGRVTDGPGGAQSLAGEDRVVVGRLMGGVEYGRPLATGWNGTAGLTWQRTGLQDEHGRTMLQDVYGQPITFSEGPTDTMALCLLRAVYSGVGDSQLVFSMEQAVPVRPDWLNFNRLRVRAERTVPVGPARLPCRFSVSAKGGAIIGDLPPYEAFPIGGTNSVRGYEEGGVGTGRNYVVASSELLVPLVSPLEGCLFVDYGSDLDSGASVPGDPAGTRGKPGGGYGYGVGARLDSPVGPLRLEYAFNDKKLGRFHFGIGKSF